MTNTLEYRIEGQSSEDYALVIGDNNARIPFSVLHFFALGYAGKPDSIEEEQALMETGLFQINKDSACFPISAGTIKLTPVGREVIHSMLKTLKPDNT